MAKSSFASSVKSEPDPIEVEAEVSTGAATAGAEETASAPTPAPTPAPAGEAAAGAVVTQGYYGGSGAQGEIDQSDLKLPRINLVQKSGKLADEFASGNFVLGKEVVIGDAIQGQAKGEPFRAVLISIRKQYQEALPYDPDGPLPRVFNTIQEVRAAGGSTVYGDPNYYKDIATALLLIEANDLIDPEQRDVNFLYEFEGKFYALALITLAGSAYTNCAKRLFTAVTVGHLRNNPAGGFWKVTSELKRDSRNSWYIPVFTPAGKTDEKFQDFVKGLVG